MRKVVNSCFFYAKNLREVKAIVESFKGYGILVTQAKVNLPTTGLATRIFKIKDQYKCLVKLKETVESTKYTINKMAQAVQKLTSKKTLSALTVDMK